VSQLHRILDGDDLNARHRAESDGALGVSHKSSIIWYKIRKDGGPDRRGVGCYFGNVTEILLFGVQDKNAYAGARAVAGKHNLDPKARA